MTAPDADDSTVAPTWDDAVEELYGLLRDDFVARRDELAKQARAGGDRDTAGAIVRLRKPSAAAWLANMLAREHPDEIGALEDLGASMRAAQDRLEGDALRRLSRQRHELVRALVERARRIARDDGVRVGDAVVRELERTITAALADASAARVLAAGGLVTALEPGAGLGAAAVTVPSSRPTSAPRPARPRSPRVAGPSSDVPDRAGDDEVERERAERERAERERLEGALVDARAEAERADGALGAAREAASSAAGEVERAVDTVAELRERLSAAEDAERAARDRAAAADRDVRSRERDAADAAARVGRAERDLADQAP